MLWFGSGCTLCQLSLAQILSWFREHRVTPACLLWVAVHGGELRPEQMAAALAKRRPMSAAQMPLFERFWRAFRKPSPSGLVRLLDADTKVVPGLRSVLRWLLQECPSRRNGLSRLENRLLRELGRLGPDKAARVVGRVLLATPREGVGDQLLFDMLRSFVVARPALVQFAEPFADRIQSWRFNGSTLSLTDPGRLALAGKADAVALAGIDRWIGGVHLHGRWVRWRWDRNTIRRA